MCIRDRLEAGRIRGDERRSQARQRRAEPDDGGYAARDAYEPAYARKAVADRDERGKDEQQQALVAVVAVSYTHLDVYKRQILYMHYQSSVLSCSKAPWGLSV